MSTTTRRVKTPSNFERYGFLFMRLSGVALLFLAVGHMFLQHIFNDVHDLSITFVAEQWRSWGWRAYDLLLLAFAASHGFNGLRAVLEDYIHDKKKMAIITKGLVIFLVITILWSGYAIFTFRPDEALKAISDMNQ